MASQTSKKAAAALAGAHRGAVDAIRYPALGANWAMNKVGLRDDAQSLRAAQSINSFATNPPWLNKDVQNFGDEAMRENPWAGVAGSFLVPGPKATGAGFKATREVTPAEAFTDVLKTSTNNALQSGVKRYHQDQYLADRREGESVRSAIINRAKEATFGADFRKMNRYEQTKVKTLEDRQRDWERQTSTTGQEVGEGMGITEVLPFEDESEYSRAYREATEQYTKDKQQGREK